MYPNAEISPNTAAIVRRRPRTIRKTVTRALTVGVLAAIPVLALGGSAHATTGVTISGSTLLINAGNAADRITISKAGSTLVVTNPADSLSASGSCTKPNPTTVNCPAAGVTIIQVSSQGGDDIVTNAADMNLRGFMGAGNDEYIGDSARDIVNGDDGDDILRGSAGNDDILSGDGGFDRGSGGPGIGDVCQTEFRSSTCEL